MNSAMTQWRMGPRGPIGLDYESLRMIAGILKIEIDAELFRKIQLLEGEFLKSLYAKDEDKECKDPRICAMCRKRCASRVADFTVH